MFKLAINSLAKSSSRTFLRPVRIKLCPFSANFRAIALPNPAVAPVIKIVLIISKMVKILVTYNFAF